MARRRRWGRWRRPSRSRRRWRYRRWSGARRNSPCHRRFWTRVGTRRGPWRSRGKRSSTWPTSPRDIESRCAPRCSATTPLIDAVAFPAGPGWAAVPALPTPSFCEGRVLTHGAVAAGLQTVDVLPHARDEATRLETARRPATGLGRRVAIGEQRAVPGARITSFSHRLHGLALHGRVFAPEGGGLHAAIPERTLRVFRASALLLALDAQEILTRRV